MRKLLLIFPALLLTGALWWNKNDVFFLLHSMRHPPKRIDFSKIDEGRIKIFYVKQLSKSMPQVAKRIVANLNEAEKTVGIKMESPLIAYIYNNWEEKGNHVKLISVGHADSSAHSVYYIVNDSFDGTRERPEYALLLQQKYGDPARPEWGRFVNAALADVWNQRTLEEWAQFLLERNLRPVFPDFLQLSRKCSPFIYAPWNSLFAKFVKEQFGWDALIRLYKSAIPPPGYQTAWDSYLQSLSVRPLSPGNDFRAMFQKGMTFAYSNGYRSGYATESSNRSLAELRTLGANAIAAVPYGFMERPDSTEIFYAGSNIFSESDESMVALAMEAHKHKMMVMMKPQLWMHYDTWTGRIEFTNAAGWQKWMDAYEDWIVHYAILSELMHVDVLCIGTELVQATLHEPQRWRKLISDVRHVYHGPLVYAANYGKEFEEITFWDALDYIGLDNYYPVRKGMESTVPEMKDAFGHQREKIGQIAMRYKKPVLFTEIGYTATKRAGMGSSSESGADYDEELQRECYRLALETYWNEPWFYGMYWWKWFSNPGDRGQDADEYSPHGRPAQMVLEQWYRKSR